MLAFAQLTQADSKGVDSPAISTVSGLRRSRVSVTGKDSRLIARRSHQAEVPESLTILTFAVEPGSDRFLLTQYSIN